ncbi:carbohydrate esterase family 15 protein [Daedalea quercina L-15889]|uniref:(4-O-methyl)-D-glucuronate--lignin esterase n=1 Tax=Daedalea quercina L-15889 TaxID=1314783 RepID=A0A165MAA7_9APHY|nr:carbohydrate esterase family 15 protein [Daedalea quercina L-15889]
MASRFIALLLFVSSALALPSPQLEKRQSACATSSTIPGYNNTILPNPFQFDDGTPVTTADDWACRRSQIAALIQGYEAGYLPPAPPIVSATFSQSGTTGTLNVTAGLSTTNTVSFSNTITYPSGTAPSSGWPLVIAYDILTIPVPDGIATLVYDNDEIAQENSLASRGVGLFYDLYGANATASAMTAWVWGTSRIIDALEQTSAANINTAKIAVTGCSRDGKGALMAGAYETRFALTIPQDGDDVQQATEIVTEDPWFSVNFDNYVYDISVLPYDHHELAAMVAPRGLISYENTEYEWLSPLSAYGCMSAAHTVYQALGIPDYHGFVEVGNHSHCYFPDSLDDSLYAFFDKFLLDEPQTNTSYFYTNYAFNGTVWDPSYWINWTTPDLS